MTPLEDRRQNVILNKIMKDTEHSRPPLLKLENSLLSFNAFVVLPIFALANAGVPLDQNIMDVISTPVAKGVILGLTVGKVARSEERRVGKECRGWRGASEWSEG